MCENFENVINTTYTSSRESIEGFYFYDSVKQAWFKILKSTFVFVSFEYSFGARWAKNHHEIIDVQKCSKKQSDHLMNCHKQEFQKLNA